MDLGTRPIRTAGKGSGSVEVTLPTELRPMVGLPCRIMLHDGAHPDIVLRPDLAVARDAFASLWQNVAIVLLPSGGAPPTWPREQFSYSLQPCHTPASVPSLAWQDGLALAACPDCAAAMGRSIAACAQVLGAELDISAALAPGFAGACGYLASGAQLYHAWQEPCDLAAHALADEGAWQAGAALRENPNWRDPALWRALRPAMAALGGLFARWSLDTSEYATLRGAWRRGRSIEISQG
jgi:hypothetical protein